MLKLNISYSKKLPVPDQQYASESCHAAVEVELPEGLNGEQLQARMHEQFALVRASVDRELQGAAAASSGPTPASAGTRPAQPATAPATARPPQRSTTRRTGNHLSDKQLGFIQDLGTRLQVDTQRLDQEALNEFGVSSVAALSREQASRFIEILTEQVALRRAA